MTTPCEFDAAYAAFEAAEAAREAAGLPHPLEGMPDPFEAFEAERINAMIARYIEVEYGTLERLEAALDKEFAGQKGRTPEEMLEWLLQDDGA